ncbi:MAG: polysaccharide biosynthesis tyrosine autokinase [Myxococcota bacterium]
MRREASWEKGSGIHDHSPLEVGERYVDPQQGQPALQIGDYLAILRLRRWLVLAIAAVFTIGGVLYSLTLKPAYVATSEVLLSSQTDPTGTVPIDVSPDTEAQVATSPQVAIKAKALAKSSLQPTEMIKNLTVSLPADSFVLDFKYSAPTPAEAQAGANAFAQGYLDFKSGQVQDGINSQIASLKTTLAQYSEDYNRSIEERNSHPEDSAAWLQADTAAQAIADLMSATNTSIVQLDSVEPNPGEVIGAATTAKSASTSPVVIVLAAAFLGLIIGSVTAFVAEGMSGSLRSAEDIERELNSPVLGVLPWVPGVHLRREMLVTEVAPTSMAGESYRMLRSGLLYAVKDEARVLLVTSSGVGEGKTTVAANLAVSLAQADKRVILVGGDLRRPEVHAYFGVPNDRGLVQVLDGGDEPPLVMTGVPNLRLLPSGPPVEMSAQLFEGGAFPELVERLREAADLVIIDAPPLAISDPLVMAEHADGILIVVDMKQADKAGLRRVRELLERAGLSPLGLILNKFEGEWSRKYGAYGAYYSPYRGAGGDAAPGKTSKRDAKAAAAGRKLGREAAQRQRDQGRRA